MKPLRASLHRPFGQRRRRRAFMLMEVLVALGMLILGLSVLGWQMHAGLEASWNMERDYTTLLLAELREFAGLPPARS